MTPEVDLQYLAELPASGTYSILRSSSWSFQVTSKGGEQLHVVLDQCTCTCLVYDKLQIQCEHAMVAAIKYNIDVKTVIGWWYKRQIYLEAYDATILPTKNSKDVELLVSITKTNMKPPLTRRPPCRLTSKQNPSIVEKMIIY